ncbi:MAG: ferredoxin--NADP reductase [Acidimicrobiales bacterium]|jgi:ferredoxin-NADP reductase
MTLSEPLAGAPAVAADHGFHPLRVAGVVRETAEASSFVLEIPADLRHSFAYESGQFCTFRVRVGGESHLRCYSMSSSPAVDPELRVTVKRTPDGVVSNWMNDHLAAGDLVDVTRPAGVFRLAAGTGDVVALCAGSGITPVLSLVKTALATTRRRVSLLYANRDTDAIIFRSEIDTLRDRYDSRFTVLHHLDVDRGLLVPDGVRSFTVPSEDPEFYVCGPGPFMDVVESTLLSDGADAGRVHIERFTPDGRVPEIESDEALGSSTVSIELDGRTESTEYRPGTTILQTARQMGMTPPFSCESGSCATCMARLLEGTASMQVNNALTDDEVAGGWVLTCQAVPTGPVVRVAYGYGED